MKITSMLSVLALFLRLILAGCYSPVSGTTSTVSSPISGTVCDTVDASIEKTHQVAMKTLQDLGFSITAERMDCNKCKSELCGCGSCCEKIHVYLQQITPMTSKICVHVGTCSDATVALHVLERVKSNIGMAK